MGNEYSVQIKTIDERPFNKRMNAYLDELAKELNGSVYGGVIRRTENAAGLGLGVKQWGVNMIEKLATLQDNLYMNCSSDMDYYELKGIYVNLNKKWIQVDSIQTYEFSYQMECHPKTEEAKKLDKETLTAEFEKFFDRIMNLLKQAERILRKSPTDYGVKDNDEAFRKAIDVLNHTWPAGCIGYRMYLKRSEERRVGK